MTQNDPFLALAKELPPQLGDTDGARAAYLMALRERAALELQQAHALIAIDTVASKRTYQRAMLYVGKALGAAEAMFRCGHMTGDHYVRWTRDMLALLTPIVRPM